jgi:hypothetical protein
VSRPSEQLNQANLDDLQRCADYRTAVQRVRAAAGRTLIGSVLALLVVSGSLVDRAPDPGLIGALVFGLLLLAGALVNLVRPMAGWIILDAALLLALAIVVGYAAFVEAKGAPATLLTLTDVVLTALAVWVLHSLRQYPTYRRALWEQPARALMALIRDLAAEVRDGDITEDAHLIEIRAQPYWRGRLSGSVGVFVDYAGCQLLLAPKEEVELAIDESPEAGATPVYVLRIGHHVLVGDMDALSYQRYVRWKLGGSEGGDTERARAWDHQ